MAKVSPSHTNPTQYPRGHRNVQHEYGDCRDGNPSNAGPRVNRSRIYTVAVMCLAGLIWGVSPALATPVASVNPIAGDGQSAALGAAFAVALKVQMVGPCGELLSGLTVNFTAPSSGASATFPNGASAVTNAQGVATVDASANGIAGSYQVTATTAGIPGIFSLTNTQSAQTAPNDRLRRPGRPILWRRHLRRLRDRYFWTRCQLRFDDEFGMHSFRNHCNDHGCGTVFDHRQPVGQRQLFPRSEHNSRLHGEQGHAYRDGPERDHHLPRGIPGL